MNQTGKVFVAATALVAVTLASIGCGTSANTIGVAQAPTATPTGAPAPTAAPTPTVAPTAAPAATPALLADGEPVALKPGQYAFDNGIAEPGILVTVPNGWVGNTHLVGKDIGDSGRDGPVLFGWPFDHGFKDPCTDHTPVLPAAGSGAAGLLGVIAAQPGLDAGPITDVTVNGHDGKYVDYVVTADPATCGDGQGDFWIWGSCPAQVTPGCENLTGDARWGASKGSAERAYAVDVDGITYTFFTGQPRDLLPADRAELQAVIDSMEFVPAS